MKTLPQGINPAPELLSDGAKLEEIEEAAGVCRACDLYKNATQTVFGSGSRTADLMIVGEQPGDREDLAGEPFVGPAGNILADALEKSGIERESVFVTNAVKHFKWVAKGKRRIHRKPDLEQVKACRPWLEAELTLVDPAIVVLLGATAAQAMLGRDFKVTQRRGEFVAWEWKPKVTATIHPSSILRIPDRTQRHEELEAFIEDFRKVSSELIRIGR